MNAKGSIQIIGVFLLLPLLLQAADQKHRTTAPPHSTVNAVAGIPQATLMNINNISAWYWANGIQESRPDLSWSAGLTYPRGTAHAVYASGFFWGGKVYDGINPALRMNGTEYSYTGLQPGRILGLRTGVAEDTSSADVRIWRIRRDYSTADLTDDAAEYFMVMRDSVTQTQIDSLRTQYARDWTEWPWQKGAPFYDANHDGIKEPGEDPGLAGADQVIWYVANDLVASQPWFCPPTGIEAQVTIWGYNRTDAIGNAVFKRLRMVYKGTALTPSNAIIDSLYLGQWADPDIGDSGDDFAGCDTTLDLGFVYNRPPADAAYGGFGLSPPAFGYSVLQGPAFPTGGSLDTAAFDFRKLPGEKNRRMTAFIYQAISGLIEPSPPFNYTGAIEWYQGLRGLPFNPLGPPDPAPLTDPTTHTPTFFWLSGDPLEQSGWVDGLIDYGGDRRILLGSGPFAMAVGDTQELVVAAVGGIAGSDLGSVAAMKLNLATVQQFYDSLVGIRLHGHFQYSGARLSMSPSSLDFGLIEAGFSSDTLSLSLFNYGSDTLRITSLSHTLSQFDLVNTPQLPFMIPPMRAFALRLQFRPTGEGFVADSVRIETNDSARSVQWTTVRGKGVVIGEAQPGVLYGSYDRLYTIDRGTGLAAAAGVQWDSYWRKSLAIHPLTRELYGVYANLVGTTIFRISGSSGDAIAVRDIAIPEMHSIAFSHGDTLYGGTTSGRLYRISVATGDTAFVGATPLMGYMSLALSPTSGRLWATAGMRPTLSDSIFVVNTTDGSLEFVGRTGVRRRTHRALGFDAAGHLYAVMDTVRQSTLYSIDTLTAAATPIGLTGVMTISGLAMRSGIVGSVPDQPDRAIPRSCVLQQNYPNPFNPATAISFQLPAVSFVTLKVYDLLGREVATLVNEVNQPGRYTVMWNADGFASGIYFYRLQALPLNGKTIRFNETRRLLLLR